MKRAAFTLIEILFVLMILGILAGVAASYYRPSVTLSDARFINLRLAQTRYRAIGFDHRRFDGGFVAGPGCIELTREGLEGDTSRAGAYRLSPKTAVTVVSGLEGNTLCFDAKGRPHDGDYALSSLLHEPVDIDIEGSDGRYRLRVHPRSGAVTMEGNR
ncbi:type IV pilin protein [Hydrogenimonas sp.]